MEINKLLTLKKSQKYHYLRILQKLFTILTHLTF